MENASRAQVQEGLLALSVCCPGFALDRNTETEIHPGTDEWPEGHGGAASVSCSIPDMVSTPWSSALSFSVVPWLLQELLNSPLSSHIRCSVTLCPGRYSLPPGQTEQGLVSGRSQGSGAEPSPSRKPVQPSICLLQDMRAYGGATGSTHWGEGPSGLSGR